MAKSEYKYGRDKKREVAQFLRNEKARITKEQEMSMSIVTPLNTPHLSTQMMSGV